MFSLRALSFNFAGSTDMRDRRRPTRSWRRVDFGQRDFNRLCPWRQRQNPARAGTDRCAAAHEARGSQRLRPSSTTNKATLSSSGTIRRRARGLSEISSAQTDRVGSLSHRLDLQRHR